MGDSKSQGTSGTELRKLPDLGRKENVTVSGSISLVWQ